MKPFHFISFYILPSLLVIFAASGCEHCVRWERRVADSGADKGSADPEFNHRRLSGYIFEECGFVNPSMEETEEDVKNMKAWKAQQMTRSTIARSEQLFIIPVYFHVIQTSAKSGMVSDARIRKYMSHLNDVFSSLSAPFTFVFKGVTRTIRSDWAACLDSDTELAMKRELKVGGADTLNLYICGNMYNKNGATISGMATRPYAGSNRDIRDGVIIDNSNSPGRLNTLVHEVGHYLGLLHTHGDNTCNPNNTGDFVDDTPQHISRASQVNCHSDPTTWDTCPLLPGRDPVDNYMVYTSDNSCRTRFTTGQIDRMIAQYELYRMPKDELHPMAKDAIPLAPQQQALGRRSFWFRCFLFVYDVITRLDKWKRQLAMEMLRQ